MLYIQQWVGIMNPRSAIGPDRASRSLSRLQVCRLNAWNDAGVPGRRRAKDVSRLSFSTNPRPHVCYRKLTLLSYGPSTPASQNPSVVKMTWVLPDSACRSAV